MADKHTPAPTPAKDVPGQKHPPQNPPKDSPPQQQGQQRPREAQQHQDPMGSTQPLRRETETLPVEPHPEAKGDPVGHARHAETPEEVEKIKYMEGTSGQKVAPPGSRNYVAGQPVDDEEFDKTENEANRLAQAGREQRTEAEQRMKENTPGDPDYHPADPDKRDTPQALGQDKDKRGASDRPGETNPKPHDKDRDDGRSRR